MSWRPKEIGGVPDGLVLFDGVCVLCSRWVRFLLERDTAGYFRFTPIQSAYGRTLARRLGIDADVPQSNAVIVGGRAYFKFDSVMSALGRVPRWRWVRTLAIVPRPLRDWCYDRIAQNRYRLFGRTETCMVPTPAIMRRFILDDPAGAAGSSGG
jgi:predicted DCC family thiol-disulfide oxidoreductase YuxK